MTEITETLDPLENRFAIRDQEIQAKVEQVSLLREIQYIPGFENQAAGIPIMSELPVLLAFSWGKEAKNMSIKYPDKKQGETKDGNKINLDTFLSIHGFSSPPNVINIVGKFEGVQQQIEQVDRNYAELNPDNPDEKQIKANFVIIQDEEVTGDIRPADCPVIVMYAKDKNGKPLIVIDHCGREALNAGMTRQGAWYLEEHYGVDLSQATAAIFPGMARKNYFITDDPHRWGNSILERNWGPYIDKRMDDTSRDEELGIERNEAGIQKRHVDMTKAAIMQLLQAGFDPKNIQAYDVDSFQAAIDGESYSHRYTTDYGGNRVGRYVIAAKLQKAA